MFNIEGSHWGRPAVFQGFSDFSHENTQLFNVCTCPAQMFNFSCSKQILLIRSKKKAVSPVFSFFS